MSSTNPLPAPYGSPVAAVNLSHRPESEEDGSPDRGGGGENHHGPANTSLSSTSSDFGKLRDIIKEAEAVVDEQSQQSEDALRAQRHQNWEDRRVSLPEDIQAQHNGASAKEHSDVGADQGELGQYNATNGTTGQSQVPPHNGIGGQSQVPPQNGIGDQSQVQLQNGTAAQSQGPPWNTAMAPLAAAQTSDIQTKVLLIMQTNNPNPKHPTKVKCPHCDIVTFSKAYKSSIITHMKSKHCNLTHLKCPFCDEVIITDEAHSNYPSLERHVREAHEWIWDVKRRKYRDL